MKFPIYNISDQYNCHHDWTVYICEDAGLYKKSEAFYKQYYHRKLFCDSNGIVFRGCGHLPSKQKWRNVLSFLTLFNVYRGQLVFKETGDEYSVDQLASHLLKQLNRCKFDNEYMQDWKKRLEKVEDFRSIDPIALWE